MSTLTITVAKDFSPSPAGRYKADGKFPGQVFRENLLLPAIKTHDQVIVDMDGTEKCGSSFLEEAFGGLVRSGIPESTLKQKIVISSQRDSDQYRIWQYIHEASQHHN
jgi:STAS-like domain of unknown function (DUF4325)